MPEIPDSLCFLNGSFGSLRDAKVSVLDRGFLFGDGIYEVVPVYRGRLFRFDEHLARLNRNLAQVRIVNPFDRGQWLGYCRQLIAAEPSTDQLLYIQVTRGVAMREHVMVPDLTPTVFIMTNPMKPPSAEQRQQGVTCITAQDFRWERGDIKSVSLLGNVLARQLSADQGATETILFRDGLLTEASSCNVWLAHQGGVVGVPKSEHVLEGIRYELIRELCEELGIGYRLRPITKAEVLGAKELMLSSATKEVLPVTRLDGNAVGSGAPGPVYARLYEAYQRAKERLCI
jgi:D-alanine transaminase